MREQWEVEEIPKSIRHLFEEFDAECGKPWVRVVDRQDRGFADRTFRSPHETGTEGMTNGQGATTLAKIVTRNTLGFAPTCSCDAPTAWEGNAVPYQLLSPEEREHEMAADPRVRPGTVLDPFCGSGTTGLVAMREGRSFVGIELNPEYAAMARRRIAGWRHKPVRAPRQDADARQPALLEVDA